MQRGLATLLGELRQGNVRVAGVAPDLGETPEED